MVDVTVRGAGIFGLSIAWACCQRGAKVKVIDPWGIGAGASGGLIGALSPHVPEAWNAKKAFQLDSLLMAGDWWGGVEAASGKPSGYGRVGRLQPLDDERAVLTARQRAETAKVLWNGKAEWRVVPASGSDWEPHSPSGWLVHDTLSARLSPRLALDSLQGALRAQGCVVRDDEMQDRGKVVHATGLAGLAALSTAFGKPLGSGVKGQALALRHDAGDTPQLFVDGLHVVPHVDGTVAVGSTSETAWMTDGPDDRLEMLLAKARFAVPALRAAEVVARWAGVRPRAISRAPVLGGWPGRQGHFVANGGFKIGFGMAPKIAEVMADLVVDGRDTVPDDFRIETLL
jgi:glycine oxidase